MNRVLTIILTVALVYGGAQLTVGSMMAARIQDFAAELAASTPGSDGRIGPLALRSSDICTLLTDSGGEAGSWKGMLARYAFIAPGRAADVLIAHYRFAVSGGCHKYGVNMITAEPRGS